MYHYWCASHLLKMQKRWEGIAHFMYLLGYATHTHFGKRKCNAWLILFNEIILQKLSEWVIQVKWIYEEESNLTTYVLLLRLKSISNTNVKTIKNIKYVSKSNWNDKRWFVLNLSFLVLLFRQTFSSSNWIWVSSYFQRNKKLFKDLKVESSWLL